MLKLILSNLRERPTRTIVSVMAVALGVAMVLVSVGLTNGQLTDHASRIQKVGGDLMLQPPRSSHVLIMNSATLNVRLSSKILEMKGVTEVAPVLVQTDGFKQLFGVDGANFSAFSPNLRFLEGRMFAEPDEMVVDDIYAQHNNVKLGDTHKVLAHPFRISGIYQSGTAVRLMVPLETVQELNGSPGKCTVFFIRVPNPADIPSVERQLKEVFDSYTITRSSDLQQIWQSNTPLVRNFLRAVVSVAVIVSFLIILLSMYSTITERTREIGILRSLGASKGYVVQLILEESLVICVIGVLLGFVFTKLGFFFVGRAFPTLPVDTPLFWRVLAPVMALVGGILGSFYPAVKAARLDPVKALGYE